MKEISSNTQQTDLSFHIQNLGSVQKGKFTQKPLTIFCGPNNSGKTWVTYALHSFYKLASFAASYKRTDIKKSLDYLKTHRGTESLIYIDNFHRQLIHRLSDCFNATPEFFQNTQFSSTLEDTTWQNWLDKYLDFNVFLIPAERNGLHLFYRELSAKRTTLLHHASKKDINISELLHDVMRSRYAEPIANYIDWLNRLSTQRKLSDAFDHEADFLQKQLAHGRYGLDRQTGDISYQPYQKKKGTRTDKLGLHLTSSTVKSLFGLWFYLKYEAKSGDVLMIDEPELNIHPSNQRLVTHLLARLVNKGMKLVISTHSDYIVREFNNLLLLSEDTHGHLLASLNQKQKLINYEKEAILQPEQVGMYLFDKQTIQPFRYTKGQGFAISTFDEVIESQNEINTMLYYGLQNAQQD